MSIEKDIQQQKFVHVKHKALVNLMFTYGWAMERIKNILSEEDITHQQYNILRILRGSAPQPLSTLQIRERMLDKMSDTSRIVDRLVVKQLAKKVTCATDRRLVDVTITEKGLKLLKKIDTETKFIDDIMANLTEEEAAALSDLLDKMRSSE